MTDFVFGGKVTVDGSDAVNKLEQLKDELAGTQVAFREARSATAGAAAALTNLTREGGASTEKINELRNALKQAQLAENEIAAAARTATAAIAEHNRATGSVVTSAGQARASMVNLGQQLGDIAQGYAAGTNPAVIFAQQSGQVAFAMSGLGGAAAGVARFLGGPWGIGLTTAAVALSPFVAKLFEADKGTKDLGIAADGLGAPLRSAAAATELLNKVQLQDQSKKLAGDARSLAEARLAQAEATFKAARAEAAKDLAAASARVTDLQDGAVKEGRGQRVLSTASTRAGSELQAARAQAAKDLADAQAQLASLDKAYAGAQARFAAQAAANDSGAAARMAKQVELQTATTAVERARAKLAIVESQGEAATKKGTAATEAWRTALTAARVELNAAEAAEASSRTGKAASTKATRDAASAERDRKKLIEDIGDALAKQAADDASAADQLMQRYDELGSAARAYADEIARINDLAGRQKADGTPIITPGQAANYRTGAAEARDKAVADYYIDWLEKAGIVSGKNAGDAFSDRVMTDAIALGRAIGGSAGDALQSIVGLIQGAKTGNYTGVPGKIGGILTLLSGSGKQPREGSFAGDFKSGFGSSIFGADGQNELAKQLKPLKPMGDAITKVFGDGGKVFGKLIGGAATGSAVSSLASAVGIKLNETGAKIGGALGQFIGGPLGSILGSVAGGIIGNLLSVKQGSTTVSSSGGKISQSSTGDATIQKATGAVGNTITDAIQAIADQLGAEIGTFSVSIGKRNDSWRVDRTGTGKIRGSTVTGTKDEGEALTLAIADALQDGAIIASPRVQQALLKYSSNVNKAVAEALKVKGLEDLLSNRANPFTTVLRDFERQAAKRVELARDYGFDVLEIEKLNAEERKKLIDRTLQSAVGSAKALLDELQYGSRAEGSFADRRAALIQERDRLSALAAGGSQEATDQLSQVLQQLLDVSKEGYGSAAPFAADRNDAVTLLQQLVRQREDQLNSAAAAAKGADPQLSEVNASMDDLVNLTQQGLLLNSQQLAALQALSGGGGGASVLGIYARQVQ